MGSGGVAPGKVLGDHALWSFGNAQSEHTETGIAFIPKTKLHLAQSCHRSCKQITMQTDVSHLNNIHLKIYK